VGKLVKMGKTCEKWGKWVEKLKR
jgi:hypothetical protein